VVVVVGFVMYIMGAVAAASIHSTHSITITPTFLLPPSSFLLLLSATLGGFLSYAIHALTGAIPGVVDQVSTAGE